MVCLLLVIGGFCSLQEVIIRVRPLSTVYINDCRCISHYLIYLSAVMRKELIKASPPGLNLVYSFYLPFNRVDL